MGAESSNTKRGVNTDRQARLAGLTFLVQNYIMFGNRFQKELDMINCALVDEHCKQELINYITPYVISVVEKFIIDREIVDTDKNELISAGWTHFNLALKKYKQRADMMLEAENDVFYFNTYFNWYIRQGVIEYLKTRIKPH